MSPAARGFALVETMVALLVLSVGLLGMAALNAHALAAVRGAQLHGVALDLAADMAERIRSNPSVPAAYAGTGAEHGCRGGVSCAPPQMAEQDLLDWRRRVAQSLPGGAAEVHVDAAVEPPRYAVRVWWDDAGQRRALHELVVRVASR